MAAAVGLSLVAAGTAWATPLTMEYTKSSAGAGLYRYDFSLTLDNHDGSWSAGQEWDWIIFGDQLGWTWNTLSFAAPIGGITISSGGHAGPTLMMASNGVSLPGWRPLAIGEDITWSGTSSLDVADGLMKWSSIVTSGGAAYVNFEQAWRAGTLPGTTPGTTPGNSVPEPSALALAGLALAGLALTRRRRAAA